MVAIRSAVLRSRNEVAIRLGTRSHCSSRNGNLYERGSNAMKQYQIVVGIIMALWDTAHSDELNGDNSACWGDTKRHRNSLSKAGDS